MALDVFGVVLTLLGFALTIAQTVRATNAAQAARAAAEAVAGRVGDLTLYSLLPRLRAAEGELRYARARDDHELAVRALTQWRDVLAETSGHLAARGLAGRRDAALIARCSGIAHLSEDLLVTRTGSVHDAVAELLREVGDLSVRLAEIAARLLTEAPHARA